MKIAIVVSSSRREAGTSSGVALAWGVVGSVTVSSSIGRHPEKRDRRLGHVGCSVGRSHISRDSGIHRALSVAGWQA
jgi:hypothetical protein